MARKKDRKTKSGGGSLMAMRSGFQSLVGTGKNEKKKSAVWNAVSWILTLALAGMAIFLVARRFF